MVYRKVFTLRTSEELINKLAHISSVNKRSINAQIEFVLEKFVQEFEEKYGKIKTSD